MKKIIILLILLFFCLGFSSPHHRIIARKNATGTLGYEAKGDSSASFEGKCNQYTAAASFTATKAYFYSALAATSSVHMAIWSDSGDAPSAELGCSTEIVGDGVDDWDTGDFVGGEQVAISNGTKYWVCYVYQTDSAATTYWYTTTAAPGTYNNDGGTEVGCETAYAVDAPEDRKVSMYVGSE